MAFNWIAMHQTRENIKHTYARNCFFSIERFSFLTSIKIHSPKMKITKPQHKFPRGWVYFTPMIQLIWIFLQREVLATAGQELWEQEVFIQRPQKKLNLLGYSQYSPVTDLPCVVMESFRATKVDSSLVTTNTSNEKFSNSHIGRDWKKYSIYE